MTRLSKLRAESPATVEALNQLVEFQQAAGEKRLVRDKLRESISILDFIPPEEHAAILAGTSVYDCLPALHAALESVPVDPSLFYVTGPTIYAPAGSYYFSGTIELKRVAHIVGDGVGHGNVRATTFHFPMDTAGVIIQSHNTTGAEGVENPPTKGGPGTTITGICVRGSQGGTVGHGIQLRARAVLQDFQVVHFAGNGIHIHASAIGGNGPEEGNANNFGLYRGASTLNGGHGIFVQGADANAGIIQHVDTSHNGGWGVYDKSFLGNTYIAHHSDSNALGGYKTEGLNQASVLMGCYSEGGQPANDFGPLTLILGGMLHAVNEPVAWLAGVGGCVTVQGGGLRSMTTKTGGAISYADIGSADPDNLLIWGATHTEKAPLGWAFRHWGNDLRMDYAGSDFQVAYFLTGPNTEVTHGRASPQPYTLHVPVIFVGAHGSGRAITSATAPPATGEWGAGDRCFNSAPAVGQPKGWICTVAGTPGTWVSEGNL